jgi:NADH:ubiquinone oxidoreductase subunit E
MLLPNVDIWRQSMMPEVSAVKRSQSLLRKMNMETLDKIITKYQGKDSWLVMMLQDIQDEYNYLPCQALETLSKKLDIPLSRIHSVATFYSSLSLKERGKHVIRVGTNNTGQKIYSGGCCVPWRLCTGAGNGGGLGLSWRDDA